MERHRLPHLCLLCSPVAPPFRDLWDARRHVREDHEIGDSYPEEFVLALDEPVELVLDVTEEPPFICVHCLRDGRHELRNTANDMDVHFRNTHVNGKDFDRMGVPKPDAKYEDDYLSSADRLQRIEKEAERIGRWVESLRTATDFLTEVNLGFYNEPPEGMHELS
jgi:hypothetical protein